MIEKYFDKICLKIYGSRDEMGKEAAREAAGCIRKLLEREKEINCLFAAAPSQQEFLAELCKAKNMEWERINAYHMDEYVGFPVGDPRSFSGFLVNHIFGRLPFKSIHLINGEQNPAGEAERYGGLLDAVPLHITFMGIGENGHIAFNDPHAADFQDPKTVKIVTLDSLCRMQQVHDGCFDSLEQVPEHAITVTCPKLISAEYVFCIVPSSKKHDAVMDCLTGPIQESCPASILRGKQNTRMYIDNACAGEMADPDWRG